MLVLTFETEVSKRAEDLEAALDAVEVGLNHSQGKQRPRMPTVFSSLFCVRLIDAPLMAEPGIDLG